MFWDVFYAILSLLIGIGIFLVGIVMFSACLGKNASRGMRSLFKKISNNRWAGVGVGAGVTSIIQSSSATTVMVIGLINAGILTLFQATAIIMGANIGTTVTALIVSLASFKIKYIFMAMACVGAIIKIITKKYKWTTIADLLISFGILFVGLDLMSNALSSNAELKNAFASLFETVQFPLLLILLGAVFTGLIQSSSASTGIFLGLVSNGLLSFNSALYLVLGANIGTCVTALLASITANTNSKRAALIHILFNTIGTVIFTAIMWPLSNYILPFYEKLIPDPVWQLSLFHVIFNVTTTLMLIGFIKPLNKLVCFVIKDKADDKEILRFTYVDERLLSTPSIAFEQTVKEINGMAEAAKENLSFSFKALIGQDLSEKEKILQTEERLDFLNQSLARFFVKLSAEKISFSDEKRIGAFHHVITDIERIGDHATDMLETTLSMKDHGIKFSETAAKDLTDMFCKVSQLYDLSLEIFIGRKTEKLKTASKLEQEIDDMKITLAEGHIKRLNEDKCTIEGGEYFYTTIIALERIADHLINIAFSIRSYIGSENEVDKI